MYIILSSTATTQLKLQAFTGIFLSGCTVLSHFEKGSPLSLANANRSLVTAAKYTMLLATLSTQMMHKRTVIQGTDML